MKIKKWKTFNEDSFEGRYRKEPEKSMIEEQDEINALMRPFIEEFGDEDCVSADAKYGKVMVNLSPSFLKLNIAPSKDDKESINDFRRLMIDIKSKLYDRGYYYELSHLDGHGFVLDKYEIKR